MSDLLALTRSFIDGGPVANPPEAPPQPVDCPHLERQSELELNRSTCIASRVAEIRRHRSAVDDRVRAELLGMRTSRTQQDWQRQMDYLARITHLRAAIEDSLSIPKLVEAELSEVRDGILYRNPEQPGDRERILVKHRL